MLIYCVTIITITLKPIPAHEAIVDGEDPNACIHMLMNYMDKLTEEIALLDSHNLINTDSDTEEGKHYDN